MNQILKVRNFLVLKKVDIEVKKINVIIGPQANGKSLIAKLLYFFQNVSKEFIGGIRAQSTKRELDKKIIDEFESKFPRYSWENSSFKIQYLIDGIYFSILGEKNTRGKTSISVNYSEDLVRLFNNKKRLYKKRLAEYKEQEKKDGRILDAERRVMFEHIIEPMKDERCSAFFSESVFIPASRSFFANLQKNIFTFLASNLDIDPFLKEFGSLYETSKRMYKDSFFLRKHKALLEDMYRALEAIVNGDYEYHDEQDWIISKGKRINLANASSGQQESLPMLLVLCVWPMLRNSGQGSMFFIEEPEAHLFPTSQGYIVSILSLLYNNLGTNFFVTSHSPYILSALNNFILASDAVECGKISNEEFLKLNGSGLPVKFEDVSAYTIIHGESELICDSEYRMVGGEILDGVSEHFESVMNELLLSER
ncbi:AAA family ATPase [Aliidiomarina haloalkalitolerans]|uniref:ATP-binding protein n=1 Tax=Aliidiomarina haloalkalitolerans TaxID=859059 RepID=A0A432VYU5_9GAMM|nr:AAA family ATPase [Aliidiomarina haloalkalitolerans]RUO21836.1 ATP-binding protein [Aliidiomarina haloalkalitolerans]